MSKYACNSCTQKSKPVDIPNRRTRRYFLFQEEKAKLRKDEDMKRYGDRALLEGKPCRGVKGPSIKSLLPLLDRSTCSFPEHLHSLCLGVVKSLMLLMFLKPGPWNLKEFTGAIDKVFLKNVQPPDDVSRLPRSLSFLKVWKASEFLHWLIFYSVPIMTKFMKKEYFQHWVLLVISVQLLSQEKISADDLHLADELLRLFLRDVGLLYPESAYTYNMHQLEHFGLCVRR